MTLSDLQCEEDRLDTMMFHSLRTRSRMTERMDAPDCCEERLLRTVEQFGSINRLLTGYRSILKRWVIADMLKAPDRAYHLVDLGAGGCDIDAWLLRVARIHNLRLRVTACDADSRIVRYAESIYADLPGLRIRHCDVVTKCVDEPVDYLFANHFLHHLSDEEALAFLRLWLPGLKRRAVFSDLHRTHRAYAGFWVFSLFYRRSFIREDGFTSIRRGFRVPELMALANAAGAADQANVHRRIPGRLVLTIDGTESKPVSAG